MADSSLERSLLRVVWAQALVAGLGLGALVITGGGVFLYEAEGLLTAAIGVVFTAIAALAAGLWAGAESAADPDRPLRARWYAAGFATALAGGFATFVAGFPALRQGVLVQVIALLVLVAIPAYTIGLLIPSLLAWAERHLDAITGEGPDPSQWEPLGQVAIGSLVGLAIGVGVSGLFAVPAVGSAPVLFGAAALFIVPTLLPEPAAREASERVIFETESALSQIRVVEIAFPGQRQPERRLYVNDEEESGEQVRSGVPTLPYIAAAEQWLADTARRGDAYLFLGGGAHTLPRRVAERDTHARITVVELDPDVTRVAYRFFGVRREHGIITVHGDARAYLEAPVQTPVDRIYLDVYAGQESLPFPLVTSQAFARMADHLAPGGSLTLNAIAVTAGSGSRRFWSLVRTVREVFPRVALFTHLGPDYPERQNVLIAAATGDDPVFPDRAGLFDSWPADQWPPLEHATVFHDLAPAPRREPGSPRERLEEARGS